jgi:hypothetical protein
VGTATSTTTLIGAGSPIGVPAIPILQEINELWLSQSSADAQELNPAAAASKNVLEGSMHRNENVGVIRSAKLGNTGEPGPNQRLRNSKDEIPKARTRDN